MIESTSVQDECTGNLESCLWWRRSFGRVRGRDVWYKGTRCMGLGEVDDRVRQSGSNSTSLVDSDSSTCRYIECRLLWVCLHTSEPVWWRVLRRLPGRVEGSRGTPTDSDDNPGVTSSGGKKGRKGVPNSGSRGDFV